MHYITPQDCVRILKVKSINDIKIPMLRLIAEQERQFAKNYYNDDSDRSDEDRENNVVNGKFGELVVMISLAKSGYHIDQGALFSDIGDTKMYGDGGIDLIVSKKDIQVKFCSGNYLNFAKDRQEDAVRKNLDSGVVVLVCHCGYKNNGQKAYMLRKLDKNLFKKFLRPSKCNNGKYIIADIIPIFDGKL